MTGGDEVGSDFWSRLRGALSSHRPRTLSVEGFVESAVLVPLFHEADDLKLLMVRRAPHLSRHGGQIAFPGGVIEPGDADPCATALRETEEELGITVGPDSVLGRLDDAFTGHGFIIAPFVARLDPGLEIRADPAEIAGTLTPSLRSFRDPRRLRYESRKFRGRTYEVPFYDCPEGEVWGATARIVQTLLGALEGAGLVGDDGA